MKTFYCIFGVVSLLIGCFGCDLAQPKNRTEYVEPATPSPAQNAVDLAQGLQGTALRETTESDVSQNEEATLESKTESEAESETQLVKADVGAGKKGHYGQKGGDGNMAESAADIITVPVATLFRAKEMTAYRIQVPQALQLFKAMNDGQGPTSHEEFMEKIIKANNIPLPELPDGQEYVYDPKTEELMIRKPR